MVHCGHRQVNHKLKAPLSSFRPANQRAHRTPLTSDALAFTTIPGNQSPPPASVLMGWDRAIPPALELATSDLVRGNAESLPPTQMEISCIGRGKA